MGKIKLGVMNSSPLTTSYGGVGPFIKNLDPFLSEAFDVTYITLPPKLHDIKYFPRRLTFLTFLFYKIKIFKKYDAILSHVPEGSFVATYSKTPLFHIFHGNFNAMTQSRFWYGKYFKGIFELFEKRILKHATKNYTVGTERPNVPKILNPIYHKVPVKPLDSRNGFIFGGRLEKIKRIDKILLIYSKLNDEIKQHNKLYIAGTGTQGEFLKQLAEELKLTDHVIFTGELANEKLIEFVSQRKISLLTSLQEGLPMAIAESLSVGVPVITTNTGDISRAIHDNYNGFLLPIQFDADDYIKKIESVLNNYQFYADNALTSSCVFKAETVAKQLISDIENALHHD